MCDSPVTVYPKYYDKNGASDHHRSYPVPCGKCPPCKKRRVAGWRFRMKEEEKVAMCVHFVTLTYDTSTVPITKNGFMTLEPRDFTLFMKQLRNLQSRQKQIPKDWPKIKYYACGEYGTLKNRPHYHIVLYNCWDLMDIGKAWQKGIVDVQANAKAGSFAYTAGYIDKEKRIPMHKNDDRAKEFSRMSKLLGINYVKKPTNIKWHLADIQNRCYIVDEGKKIPMPRYYKQKIYKKWQRDKIAQKAKQIEMESDHYNDTKLESDLKLGKYYNFYHFKKIRE